MNIRRRPALRLASLKIKLYIVLSTVILPFLLFQSTQNRRRSIESFVIINWTAIATHGSRVVNLTGVLYVSNANRYKSNFHFLFLLNDYLLSGYCSHMSLICVTRLTWMAELCFCQNWQIHCWFWKHSININLESLRELNAVCVRTKCKLLDNFSHPQIPRIMAIFDLEEPNQR